MCAASLKQNPSIVISAMNSCIFGSEIFRWPKESRILQWQRWQRWSPGSVNDTILLTVTSPSLCGRSSAWISRPGGGTSAEQQKDALLDSKDSAFGYSIHCQVRSVQYPRNTCNTCNLKQVMQCSAKELNVLLAWLARFASAVCIMISCSLNGAIVNASLILKFSRNASKHQPFWDEQC